MMSGEVVDNERVKKITDELLDRDRNKRGPDFKRDFNQVWELMKEEVADELDNPRQIAFLSAYSILGAVTYAAKIAGISPSSVYKWKKDETFMKHYRNADKAHIEYMEQEAKRRAIMGVSEDVFYQGEKVGEKRKYSDSLLKMLLQGEQPDKYRSSKIEINGGENAKIQVNFGTPELNQDIDDSELDEEDNITEIEGD